MVNPPGDGLQAGGCYKPGMRLLLFLVGLLVPAAAISQQAGAQQQAASPQLMADVRAGDWNGAQSLASATGDPLLSKLVLFFQLTNPGGGTGDEIQQFIDDNPDWPEQGLLALRAAEANGVVANPPAEEPDFLAQTSALDPDQAAALWIAQGQAAFAAASADQQLMFWPAQNDLARTLLAEGNAKSAYAVVIAVGPPVAGATARAQIADRDFLAGFLRLRFLHDPAGAIAWFTDLQTASTAAITQARAYYWRARCEAGAVAQADYRSAAFFPSTYYGQLAALALGDTPAALAQRILAAGEPPFTSGQVVDFALMELPRAAALLVQMNDTDDAAIFLNRLGQIAPDDTTRELAARLAIGLGLPSSAISIARTAGIAGQMLIREGWPIPVSPPATVEAAIALGIMRQESSFDPGIMSPAGALGLMQLMPETARRTARQTGLAAAPLTDPDVNMALGTAYLNMLIQNFGDCLPLAIAAYNAGPTNVANWLAIYGDPEMTGAGGADIIDWIEEIPFNETRNYVQRVTESIVIYRALQTGTAEDPVSRWMVK